MTRLIGRKPVSVILTIILTIFSATLTLSTVPVQASTDVNLVLLSGVTGANGEITQTAGYTYSDPSIKIVTYASGTGTQTAGYTTADPSSSPLDPSQYSNKSFIPASTVVAPSSYWVNLNNAQWVSTTSDNSGAEVANEGDVWRLYSQQFTAEEGVTSASIQIAVDNAYEVYLNGDLLATTAAMTSPVPVYGVDNSFVCPTSPFECITTYSFTPAAGSNTLMIIVRNWNNFGNPNPTGVIYQVDLQYGTQDPLNATAYGDHSAAWSTSAIVDPISSYWIDSDLGGAKWVSTTSENVGSDNDYKGDAWRLFKEDFSIPAGVVLNSATLQISADNAFEAYVNKTLVGTTAAMDPSVPVYGTIASFVPSMYPFETTWETSCIIPYIHSGLNTLEFIVRNWDDGTQSNPTGLLFKAEISYTQPASDSFSVNASVDGEGGTVSPPTQTVSNGGSASISITPDPGYAIFSVLDNNLDVTSQIVNQTYSISDVSADHDIFAKFTAVTPTPTNTQNPAWDLNGDHTCDIGDVVMIGIKWGLTGAPGWIPEDVNKDGVIDIGDVVVLGLHWGETW